METKVEKAWREKRDEVGVNRIIFNAIKQVADPKSVRFDIEILGTITAFIGVAVSRYNGNVRTALRIAFGEECELLFENGKTQHENAEIFIELVTKKWL